MLYVGHQGIDFLQGAGHFDGPFEVQRFARVCGGIFCGKVPFSVFIFQVQIGHDVLSLIVLVGNIQRAHAVGAVLGNGSFVSGLGEQVFPYPRDLPVGVEGGAFCGKGGIGKGIAEEGIHRAVLRIGRGKRKLVEHLRIDVVVEQIALFVKLHGRIEVGHVGDLGVQQGVGILFLHTQSCGKEADRLHAFGARIPDVQGIRIIISRSVLCRLFVQRLSVCRRFQVQSRARIGLRVLFGQLPFADLRCGHIGIFSLFALNISVQGHVRIERGQIVRDCEIGGVNGIGDLSRIILIVRNVCVGRGVFRDEVLDGHIAPAQIDVQLRCGVFGGQGGNFALQFCKAGAVGGGVSLLCGGKALHFVVGIDVVRKQLLNGQFGQILGKCLQGGAAKAAEQVIGGIDGHDLSERERIDGIGKPVDGHACQGLQDLRRGGRLPRGIGKRLFVGHDGQHVAEGNGADLFGVPDVVERPAADGLQQGVGIFRHFHDGGDGDPVQRLRDPSDGAALRFVRDLQRAVLAHPVSVAVSEIQQNGGRGSGNFDDVVDVDVVHFRGHCGGEVGERHILHPVQNGDVQIDPEIDGHFVERHRLCIEERGERRDPVRHRQIAHAVGVEIDGGVRVCVGKGSLRVFVVQRIENGVSVLFEDEESAARAVYRVISAAVRLRGEHIVFSVNGVIVAALGRRARLRIQGLIAVGGSDLLGVNAFSRCGERHFPIAVGRLLGGRAARIELLTFGRRNLRKVCPVLLLFEGIDEIAVLREGRIGHGPLRGGADVQFFAVQKQKIVFHGNAAQGIQVSLYLFGDGQSVALAVLIDRGKRFGARVIGAGRIRIFGHGKDLVCAPVLGGVHLRVHVHGIFLAARDEREVGQGNGEVLGKFVERGSQNDDAREVARHLVDGHIVEQVPVHLEQSDVLHVVHNAVRLRFQAGGNLQDLIDGDVALEQVSDFGGKIEDRAFVRLGNVALQAKPARHRARPRLCDGEDEGGGADGDKYDDGQKNGEQFPAQAESGFYHIFTSRTVRHDKGAGAVYFVFAAFFNEKAIPCGKGSFAARPFEVARAFKEGHFVASVRVELKAAGRTHKEKIVLFSCFCALHRLFGKHKFRFRGERPFLYDFLYLHGDIII